MSKGMACLELADSVLPDGVRQGTSAYRTFCELIEEHLLRRPHGTILKFEGDTTGTIYFLASGWLSLSKSTANGHRQIVDILLPGEFLNPGSADPNLSPVEITAMTWVKYAAIPRANWLHMLQLHPEVHDALNRRNAAAMARMEERMLRLGKGSAESRIAYAMCELCLRTSKTDLVTDGRYHIPMNQQQFGDFTGLSSVHVCRTMRRFQNKDILRITDHMDVEIHDLDSLIEIAEIDPVILRKEIIPAIS